jgi:uncharacterized protein (DUF2267 family)
MSTTGLEVFDKTLQETHLWLKALLHEIGGDDRHRAYIVLRATLHALRDRLGPPAAAQLGAQLPMLLRGLFYEGWRPGDPPSRERHLQAFLDHVRAELPAGMRLNTEDAVRCTFRVVVERIDAGEAAKLAKQLPHELRDLWPRSVREH